MTKAPFFFVLTARAGRGLYFLPADLRQQLTGRLTYIAIDRTPPADAQFAAALADPAVTDPNMYFTALVMFSVMSHHALVAAERQMYSYGFGADRALTRQELLKGMASILPGNPSTGLMQSVVYFDNGATSGNHRVACLVSTTETYKAYAILGTSIPLALIDPMVLNALLAPQQADYDAVALAADDGKEAGAMLALLVLLAVPLALVLLLLWRRRQDSRQKDQENVASSDMLKVPPDVERRLLPVFESGRLILTQKWGLGTFSRVLLGTLDSSTTVILKQWQLLDKAPPEVVAQTTAQLQAEWQTVADLHYIPQVLAVYGFTGKPERLTGVAVECCVDGDLHSFLLRHAASIDLHCRLAADIAAGMAAIVETGAVHYDLTARRIYVMDGGRRCKLAHFGERGWRK